MARQAVVLSYRLGGTDGVSVEARKWEWALGELGFTTRRVAGELCGAPSPDDVALPGLAIDPLAGAAADTGALAAALDGAGGDVAPGGARARRVRRRRLRGRRRRGVPVDVGGLRESRHRVGDRAPPARSPPLPGARRDRGRR